MMASGKVRDCMPPKMLPNNQWWVLYLLCLVTPSPFFPSPQKHYLIFFPLTDHIHSLIYILISLVIILTLFFLSQLLLKVLRSCYPSNGIWIILDTWWWWPWNAPGSDQALKSSRANAETKTKHHSLSPWYQRSPNEFLVRNYHLNTTLDLSYLSLRANVTFSTIIA